MRHFVEEECVICLDSVPDTILIPCNHVCLCKECSVKVTSVRVHGGPICPLCRQPIERVDKRPIEQPETGQEGARSLYVEYLESLATFREVHDFRIVKEGNDLTVHFCDRVLADDEDFEVVEAIFVGIDFTKIQCRSGTIGGNGSMEVNGNDAFKLQEEIITNMIDPIHVHKIGISSSMVGFGGGRVGSKSATFQDFFLYYKNSRPDMDKIAKEIVGMLFFIHRKNDIGGFT